MSLFEFNGQDIGNIRDIYWYLSAVVDLTGSMEEFNRICKSHLTTLNKTIHLIEAEIANKKRQEQQ